MILLKLYFDISYAKKKIHNPQKMFAVYYGVS